MEFKKGDKCYYVRFIKNCCDEILELKIRTVTTDYVVGVEKRDRRAIFVYATKYNVLLFHDRGKALDALKNIELNEE